MKQLQLFLPLLILLTGCADKGSWAPLTKTHSPQKAQGQQHGQSMGGVEALITGFKTLDRNGDGQVTPAEFNARFPKVSQAGFDALDLNSDRVLDEREWRHFKKVHGVTRYPDNAV